MCCDHEGGTRGPAAQEQVADWPSRCGADQLAGVIGAAPACLHRALPSCSADRQARRSGKQPKARGERYGLASSSRRQAINLGRTSANERTREARGGRYFIYCPPLKYRRPAELGLPGAIDG